MFQSGVVRPREERGQAGVDDPERRLILVIFGSYGEVIRTNCGLITEADCLLFEKCLNAYCRGNAALSYLPFLPRVGAVHKF
jgi:hypothetical protein